MSSLKQPYSYSSDGNTAAAQNNHPHTGENEKTHFWSRTMGIPTIAAVMMRKIVTMRALLFISQHHRPLLAKSVSVLNVCTAPPKSVQTLEFIGTAVQIFESVLTPEFEFDVIPE